MTVFLINLPNGGVQVTAFAESEDGKTFGDLIRQMAPSEIFMGWTGAELRELGEGKHDLQDKAKMMAEIVGGTLDEGSLAELVDKLGSEGS